MTQNEKDALVQKQREIILMAQAYLASTDYIAAKIAEGVATKEEYVNHLAERQQWRKDINDANERIAELESIEPDVEESASPTEEE